MGSERHVCPACGQPVETVVRRHKTLGTWVPLWVAGPCRNPACGADDTEGAGSGTTGDGTRSAKGPRPAGNARDADRARPAEGTTPPATTPPSAPGDTTPGETVAKNS